MILPRLSTTFVTCAKSDGEPVFFQVSMRRMHRAANASDGNPLTSRKAKSWHGGSGGAVSGRLYQRYVVA